MEWSDRHHDQSAFEEGEASDDGVFLDFADTNGGGCVPEDFVVDRVEEWTIVEQVWKVRQLASGGVERWCNLRADFLLKPRDE